MARCLFLALTLLSLVAAPVAFAGGWAVTTLDDVPSSINAGETYAIGYTIRQHGQSPLTTSQSGIEVRDAKGALVERFVGISDGTPGHYVAQVRFPAAGEWQWTVDQTPFQPQPLGSVMVQAAAATPAQPIEAPVTAPDPVWSLLPTAALLATMIFAWRLVAFTRQRRSLSN
jgi:hypothetical protein